MLYQLLHTSGLFFSNQHSYNGVFVCIVLPTTGGILARETEGITSTSDCKGFFLERIGAYLIPTVYLGVL